MPFNTLTFGVFFALVLASYCLVGNWVWRKVLLLVASYAFYAAWNPPFVLILWFSTVVDWFLAGAIDRSGTPRKRKLLLIASLTVNLSLLGYFKYGEFLLDTFVDFLAGFGIAYAKPRLDIVLPAGISFYTFQSLSYTIDVYRRKLRANATLFDYALFVSFFPQLVAGPIVRAMDFLPQLISKRIITKDLVGWGLTLILFGLFQKVVLADHVFAPIADEFYAQAGLAGAIDAWAGVFAFSGQIFCDFAGYSTCAIGAALCLGFELPDNFRSPYAAIGFSDFWRRWHITLSTWLRDYLYIPLGGNREGTCRTYLNLMLTMLLGGLWHGASWMFVLWGGLHGALLAIEHFFRDKAALPASGPIRYLLSLATFLAITLTWVPFRAPDMATLFQVAEALFRFDREMRLDLMRVLLVFSCIYGLIAWHWNKRDEFVEEWFPKLRLWQQVAIGGLCAISVFLVSGGDHRAFIYFQF